MNNSVWLLTGGDGSDGWGVESIHETREGAERAKEKYETTRKRAGSTYILEAQRVFLCGGGTEFDERAWRLFGGYLP